MNTQIFNVIYCHTIIPEGVADVLFGGSCPAFPSAFLHKRKKPTTSLFLYDNTGAKLRVFGTSQTLRMGSANGRGSVFDVG